LTLSITDVAVQGTRAQKAGDVHGQAVGVSGSPITSRCHLGSTATAGSDYVARSLAGQAIPAGQTSRSFTVTLNGDTVLEPNETFAVTLSSVTGATVFDGKAIGTILNDEGPTLSIADVAIAEGNSGTKGATFTVRLSVAPGSPVTYNIATVHSTSRCRERLCGQSLAEKPSRRAQITRAFGVV
jgi:hypothetical protein